MAIILMFPTSGIPENLHDVSKVIYLMTGFDGFHSNCRQRNEDDTSRMKALKRRVNATFESVKRREAEEEGGGADQLVNRKNQYLISGHHDYLGDYETATVPSRLGMRLLRMKACASNPREFDFGASSST